MPPAKRKPDPRVTKRRVTMRSISLGPEGEQLETIAKDYVRPDFLEAYVRVAKDRWQHVTVSDEPDAGPAGFDGPTYVPATYTVRDTEGIRHIRAFPHPLAGTYYPATDCGPDCSHAPQGARVVHPSSEG